MRITALRKLKYEGYYIYIMQFLSEFQYMFAWDGDIYQYHMTIKPNLMRWIKWRLGMRVSPYTVEELEEGEGVLLSGAMATLDKLLLNPETRQVKKQREKEELKFEREIENRKSVPCEWQTRETAEGNYYMCLIHGFAVKMKDGVRPSHE